MSETALARPALVVPKRVVWRAVLMLMGLALIYLTFLAPRDLAASYQSGSFWALALGLAVAALICEYFDSSLGMGYGTTLTPLLMILGFKALDIVPCILLSEMVTGFGAGLTHHGLGNVSLRRGSQARQVMLVLAACSVLGTVGATMLAVKLPKSILNAAIGGLILAVGLFLLAYRRGELRFSWRRIVALGVVAAFNKGLSGGGYGPLVTGGQILAGVNEKNAVGITSLAEGFVCLVSLVVYVLAKGWPDWHMFAPLALGACLSVPLAAYTVRLMPPRMLQGSIGWVTAFLGALALLKALLGVSGGGGAG